MKHSIRTTISVAVLCLLTLANPASAAGENDYDVTLSLGLQNSSKPSAMVRKYRPIVSLLQRKVSQRLGKRVRIRMQVAKSNQKGIEYLANGKVDFALLGAATYVEAKTEIPDIQILAIESKNRTKVVNGIIATGLHSSIRTISDLRGQSFAFGDLQSTSGRFMAQRFLLENGIGAKHLSRYEYLGRHDIVGVKVGVGDFAAGAMSESTFRKLLSDGEKIRELARFPIVSKPWVTRPGIDAAVYSALKISLLEMSNEQALERLEINGFVEGTNEDYRVIANAMSRNHLFFSDDDRKPVEWVLATSNDNKNDGSSNK